MPSMSSTICSWRPAAIPSLSQVCFSFVITPLRSPSFCPTHVELGTERDEETVDQPVDYRCDGGWSWVSVEDCATANLNFSKAEFRIENWICRVNYQCLQAPGVHKLIDCLMKWIVRFLLCPDFHKNCNITDIGV
jgi:hypothetical protein